MNSRICRIKALFLVHLAYGLDRVANYLIAFPIGNFYTDSISENYLRLNLSFS